jgi:hypothetical protein
MLVDGVKCPSTESAGLQKPHVNGDYPNVLPKFQDTEQSLNLNGRYSVVMIKIWLRAIRHDFESENICIFQSWKLTSQRMLSGTREHVQ